MADTLKHVSLVFDGAITRDDLLEEFVQKKEGREFAATIVWSNPDDNDLHRVSPKDIAKRYSSEKDQGRAAEAEEKVAAYKKGLVLLIDLLEREKLLDAAILLKEDLILLILLLEGKTEEYYDSLVSLAMLMKAANGTHDALQTLKHVYKSSQADGMPLSRGFWLASATAFFETGSFKKALKCFNELLKYDKETNRPIEKAATTFHQVVALNLQMKQFGSAAMAQKELVTRLITQSDEPRTQSAKSLLAEETEKLGDILVLGENFAASFTFFEQAIGVFQVIGEGKRAAQVHLKLAKSLRVVDHEQKALESLERGVTLLKEAGMSGSPVEASILEEMASIYITQGLTSDAHQMLKVACSIRQKSGDTETIEDAECCNLHADLAAMEGHIGEAISLVEGSLRVVLELAGQRSKEAAVTYRRLGSLFLEQGKFEEAQEYLLLALDITRSHFDDNSLEVTRDMLRVAALLCRQGKYREAMPLVNRSIQIRKIVLDDADGEHDMVARAMATKAEISQAMENYKGAEKLWLAAIEIGKRQLGEKHFEVIRRTSSLGQLYMTTGKLKKADRFLKESLQLSFLVFGNEHPRTAAVLSLLAKLLCHRQQYKQAEVVLTKAIAVNKKYYGRRSPAVARNLDEMGHIMMHQQQLEQAEKFMREALQIRISIFGELHQEIANSMESIAQLMKEKGDSESSAGYGLGALAIYEATLGDDHPLSEEARIRWF